MVSETGAVTPHDLGDSPGLTWREVDFLGSVTQGGLGAVGVEVALAINGL
jgi:hypothetical protein